MGHVHDVPNVTILQLREEAHERFGRRLDPVDRQIILLLPRRSDRTMMETHGAGIQLRDPAFALFHRPRGTEDILDRQGFDHRQASFLLLDVAKQDLGRWMQSLIQHRGWIRSFVTISPVPFSVDLPSQRPFQNRTLLTFRDPTLPALEHLQFAFPPESVPGRAFVSLPEADLVRTPEHDPLTEPRTSVEPVSDRTDEDGFLDGGSMPPPPPFDATETRLDEAASEIRTSTDEEDTETLFLRTIADLRERGVEVADLMGHPEFMDISELATAAGLDTWSLFLQATASSTSVGSYRE